MPDLICYIPNHGYADETPVFVSWLGGNFFIHDPDQDSFKLEEAVDGVVVQFTETITNGFVREDAETPISTIAGLDHLEGETVTVTSGGEVIGSFVVSNGIITLSSELTTYQAGLPYTCKIRSTRIASPQIGNALQGQIKNINRLTTRYVKTKEGKVGVEYPVTSNSDEEVMTEFLQDMNAVFDTDSRDVKRPADGGMNTDGYVVHKSEKPFPMTIISNVVELTIEETR